MSEPTGKTPDNEITITNEDPALNVCIGCE